MVGAEGDLWERRTCAVWAWRTFCAIPKCTFERERAMAKTGPEDNPDFTYKLGIYSKIVGVGGAFMDHKRSVLMPWVVEVGKII